MMAQKYETVVKDERVTFADSFYLTSGEVHSWCVSLDVSPEIYARLHATLTIDECVRSARFRFECDRRRFVIAHGVLRELLARYLRTQPSRIRYEYNAFGKPELGSEFGNRIKFNLSHSAGLALIAVAADSNVGVDLEYIRVIPDYVEIARRYFTIIEVDHLKRLPSRLRAKAFFSYWTRTEAYIKACGEGLVNIDGGSNDSTSDQRWSLYSLRPASGFVGALAIEGRGWRLVRRNWQTSVDTFH